MCAQRFSKGIQARFVSRRSLEGRGPRSARSRESCQGSPAKEGQPSRIWCQACPLGPCIRRSGPTSYLGLTPPTLLVRGFWALTMQTGLKLGHMVGLVGLAWFRTAGIRTGQWSLTSASSLLAFAAPEGEIDRVETAPGFEFRALNEYYTPHPGGKRDRRF